MHQQECGRTAGGRGLLRFDIESADGTVTLRAWGEVDLATGEQFESALDAALDRASGCAELVVDLQGLTFVDAGGIRSVTRLARGAAERGVRLRLLSAPALDDIVRVLGGWERIGVERDGGAPSEYAHLMPLFVERSRLPDGDRRRPALRRALITGYLPVAQHIARRFRNRGENLDDLEQVAALGLINAVDRFEVDREVDFLAFAVPTITGELQRHHRDRVATIRVPRRVRALQAMALRAADELRRRGGGAPRPSEIARHLGVEQGAVIEALEAVHRGNVASLDEPFGGGDDAGEGPRLAAALAVSDPDVGLVVDRESVGPLLAGLPERERRIVLLRFFGNKTQSEIAAEVGISQMHVSRLLAATLAGLRKALDESPRSAD